MEGEKIKMIWRLLWLLEYFNESLTPPDMSVCVCVCEAEKAYLRECRAFDTVSIFLSAFTVPQNRR